MGLLRANIAIKAVLVCIILVFSGCAQQVGIGRFAGQGDVGKITLPGSAKLDETSGEYTIMGSGANIWNREDAFQYIWDKAQGDMVLTTDISWSGKEELTHKKAGWMVRQDLSADAAYVDAMYHGDGLICLQFRREKGAMTQDVCYPVMGAATMKLSRHGDVFSLEISRKGRTFEPVGAISVPLSDPVYAGLAVSSHDEKVTETAVFSNVSRENLGVVETKDRVVESTLEVISVKSGKRRIVYRAKEHFEAPNWLPDGKGLLFNSKGRIYTIPVAGGKPKLLDTGAAVKCNNDHGITFDGKTLIISDGHEGRGSIIYTLPLKGGKPRKITDKAPSYWHGVSPDGKTLVYCAERNGQYDVYAIGMDDGEETQLTNTPGLDDGPEYSPDGKYIYFNSVRTGLMKIWRMKADGSEQSQMTFGGDHNDWFAHPSPDGEQLVFISYDTTVEPHTHLPNKNVELRIMPVEGGEPKSLTKLFGGQGTINVPSWSPDSNYVAFVSYRLVKP